MKQAKALIKKQERELEKAKARYKKALVMVPKVKNLNPNGGRLQVSIKNKKQIITHMLTFGLTARETAVRSGATTSQIYAWKKDFNEGRLNSKYAIAVTRN